MPMQTGKTDMIKNGIAELGNKGVGTVAKKGSCTKI